METDITTHQRMKNVHTKNTPIEIAVRKIIFNLGYRFRLHRSDLPGKPDIVLPKYKMVIFVHGCFWHGHSGCKKGRLRPKKNVDFWERKISYNQVKDKRVKYELEQLGWKVIVVWECELSNTAKLRDRLSMEIGNCG
jgi:DNA mismatch endonuclease (patch repair protein)